jgi:hypothetical protein
VSPVIRNKWLAVVAVFLTLTGVERIAEWYFYGYATKQSPSMPEATGVHALVTGVALLVLAAWVALASTRGKSTTSKYSPAPENDSNPDR